jgi:hypothetical protein
MSNLGFLSSDDNPKSRPDFFTMTDVELRAYVLANRRDIEAFHAYVDRMQQRPPIAIIEPEEWSEERMQEVLEQKDLL